MSESITPLRKLSRAQLLEMLVEQGKAINELREENEHLKKDLADKDAENEKALLLLKRKLQKSNAQVKALKESLDAEQRIRMQSLLKSRTISEASAYMNQLLEDTRKANILYQKLIMKLAEEARKHEQTGK